MLQNKNPPTGGFSRNFSYASVDRHSQQGGTVAERTRYTRAQKETLIEGKKCYVCDDLGLNHAGFEAYELREIHFDHYQQPHGNVGSAEGAAGSDVLPIHAAAGGARPEDPEFEESLKRNCHASRGNKFTSRGGYVQVLRARMAARFASYIDDVYENPSRKAGGRQYKLPAEWNGSKVAFLGKDYPVVSEERNGQVWNRFLTTLPPKLVFTDDTSQVRQATKKTVQKMVETFLIDGFPMFAPVNARIDRCGHVIIFDGNHRATSHTLAFGVEAAMPIMIWDIKTGDECALRDRVSTES
jgi:hypothetical protein